MSLSTFFEKDQPIMNEREHISYHPPWKDSGSKTKDPQLALSALTLLAFLFFLNMLQSCLKDSLQSQAPITIMMTTTTTTTETEAQRHKRSNDEINVKEERFYDNEDNKADFVEDNNIKDQASIAKEMSGYNIFILEETLTFQDINKNMKKEEFKTVKTRETKDSSTSNRVYDKACCKCESKDKKTKKKNSKKYLRVGISLVCEFIEAISVQGKCSHDRCKN